MAKEDSQLHSGHNSGNLRLHFEEFIEELLQECNFHHSVINYYKFKGIIH